MLFFAATVSFAAGDTLVFLDLPERHQEATADAFTSTSQTNSKTLFVYSPDEYKQHTRDEKFSVILATSAAGCELILQDKPDPDRLYVCSLLQSRDYFELSGSYPQRNFIALAIDQPEERQINVTRRVFPQLKRFAILESDTQKPIRELSIGDSVATRTNYRSGIPLSRQIQSILATNDAIVALPDNQIYTKDNIRTILFTAYTNEKPVIGYSPGYVRAGALISAYSTPLQLMTQLNEILADSRLESAKSTRQLYYSKYFSISLNLSVAESLSLFKALDVDENKTYVDEDFE